MLINEYIQLARAKQRVLGKHPALPIEAVKCRDGFTVSVQAGHSSYCTPRIDNAPDYDEVECGFPSQPVPEWAGYGDDAGYDSQGRFSDVFGYVPVNLVDRVIAQHGGIVNFEYDAEEGDSMKRLFMLRRKRKGAVVTTADGTPLYFSNKMDAKKVRDDIGGDTVVSLGPDHWRNVNE